MPLRIYNTASKRVEAFTPRDPSRVTFYSCGPTVYDDSHIGNFRAFLIADVLRRWIEHPLCEVTTEGGNVSEGPREVVHVMNITDVGHMTDDAVADGGGEDKMEVAERRLKEAKKSGELPAGAKVDPEDPYDIARFYAERFVADAKKLGLKLASEADRDPTLLPRATDNVPGMVEMIEGLVASGHAYAVGEPGKQAVYFSVESFPNYGRLSGNTLDKLREGQGGRVSDSHQREKKHPADFLLWKADPSHKMKWDSPWGAGYPGWHIECSVMALGRLGVDGEIDVHSGGEDNIFPHHECEVAQSCCATGHDVFARLWFHGRFLMLEGEKMSKSKGTFFTARDLFAKGYEPAAVRLELIKTHYRANANFTWQGLADSGRMVDRWRRFVETGESSGQDGHANESVTDAFVAAMNDDLNVAGAIGVVNKWINETDSPTRADAERMKSFDRVFGVLDLERGAREETSIGVFEGGAEASDEVVALLEERAGARKSKDFARSDEIRDQLLSMGYAIKDVAGGKVEVRPS